MAAVPTGAAGIEALSYFGHEPVWEIVLLLGSLSILAVQLSEIISELPAFKRRALRHEQEERPALFDGLGRPGCGDALRASTADREWTAGQVEMAEARRQVTATRSAQLAAEALQARTVDDLYQVLVRLHDSLGEDAGDEMVARTMAAVTDGRVSEDDVTPLLEKVSVLGDSAAAEALHRMCAAGPDRAARDDARRVLADAFAEDRLSEAEYEQRLDGVAAATSVAGLDAALRGLRRS